MDEEYDPWEEDQSVPDEESSYGGDEWTDECSNTDSDEELYEEDPEPEPPDPYQDDNIPTDWSRHQAEPRGFYESDSWQEETEAKSSLESSEDWEHEPDEEAQLQLDAKEGPWEYQDHPDTGQENKLWCEDTNSYISLGETDEEEEEALDQEADPEEAFGDSSGREELNLSPDSDQDIEERSWCGEPFSGHEERQALSIKPYQDFSSWYEETDSQISDDETRQTSNETESQGGDLGVPEEEEALSEAGRNDDHPHLGVPEEEEAISEAGRNVIEHELHSIYFTGYGKRNETYLEWEDKMEALFQKHHVQEEEKMSYATKTLTGPAYAWWAKEEYDIWYCGDPDHTWESFKFEMLEEFVKKGPVHELPLIFTQADWSHTSTTSSKSGSKPANQHHYPQKTEPVVVKKVVNKLESSQPSSLQSIKVPEIFPYSKGTFQPREKEAEFVLRKDGPKTEVEALTPSLQKPPASSPIQGKFSNSKNVKIQTCYRCHKRGHFAVNCPSRKLLGSTSPDLKSEPIKSDSLVPLELSNSGFKHLSLSKGFDPGIRQDDGRPRRGVKVKENQGQLLTCLQNVEEEGRISKRTHAAKEQIILQPAENIWVNLNLNFPIYILSNPDIIHLFPGKSVKFISGTEASDHMEDQHKEIKRCLGAKVKQEVTTSNFLIPDDPPVHAPPNRSSVQNRGVLLSILLQEEPPDVPSKIKPIKYQGKALESQKRMKPNLLYLGADNPVSRLKLFQGRGYDAAIKPVADPESTQQPLQPAQALIRIYDH
ncbi:hypothetical protein N665_1731s0001 [Sinapis alba]|nr:hypothetical protein N665_1731s0001 [Sinapis alba]